MGEKTAIAWTHHTFNPWIGCVKVSDGCKNCYAETYAERYLANEKLWGPAATATRRRTGAANWLKPKQWNREAAKAGKAERVFCASLADVMEDHPAIAEARDDLFALIRETPFLWWQILTKRPENFHRFLPDDWGDGYPNVWLGTSIEDMRVIGRVEYLRNTPAVVRFISYEPALGPLEPERTLERVDWIIYGGESGPNFRADNVEWARTMRDACRERGVAFFDKQRSGPRTEMGPALSRVGEPVTRQYPVPRSVRSNYQTALQWSLRLDSSVVLAYAARAHADSEAA